MCAELQRNHTRHVGCLGDTLHYSIATRITDMLISSFDSLETSTL